MHWNNSDFYCSITKRHEHADGCEEAFCCNILTLANRPSNHPDQIGTKLKDFARSESYSQFSWRCIHVSSKINACVVLASYRRWTHRELMLFTFPLSIIQFLLKNGKKNRVHNDPFQRPWVKEKCGANTGGIAHHGKKKHESAKVMFQALTNCCVILQLFFLLTLLHLHTGPLFVTGFSKWARMERTGHLCTHIRTTILSMNPGMTFKNLYLLL